MANFFPLAALPSLQSPYFGVNGKCVPFAHLRKRLGTWEKHSVHATIFRFLEAPIDLKRRLFPYGLILHNGIEDASDCTSSLVLRELTVVETQTSKMGQRVNYSPPRRSPRIKLQVPVFVRGADSSGAEFIELTKTLNISATGACIASAHILRPDQVVYLTIPAPSPAPSSTVPSETPPIAARVLRQDTAGELRLFGLEFLRALE